jgi:hypothetical protein
MPYKRTPLTKSQIEKAKVSPSACQFMLWDSVVSGNQGMVQQQFATLRRHLTNQPQRLRQARQLKKATSPQLGARGNDRDQHQLLESQV